LVAFVSMAGDSGDDGEFIGGEFDSVLAAVRGVDLFYDHAVSFLGREMIMGLWWVVCSRLVVVRCSRAAGL
jgi:hypothetical protein